VDQTHNAYLGPEARQTGLSLSDSTWTLSDRFTSDHLGPGVGLQCGSQGSWGHQRPLGRCLGVTPDSYNMFRARRSLVTLLCRLATEPTEDPREKSNV
jgi:hypothetical protein